MGFTGNQEIPIAKSIVDYIFRWLGSRFLSPDDKANLGLIDRTAVVADVPVSSPGSATVDSAVATASAVADPAPTPASLPPASVARPKPTEADAPKATAVAAEPRPKAPSRRPSRWPSSPPTAPLAANGHANGNGNGKTTNGNGGGAAADHAQPRRRTKVSFQTQADAPSCMDCGSIMVRNGSCYKCLNCGTTAGRNGPGYPVAATVGTLRQYSAIGMTEERDDGSRAWQQQSGHGRKDSKDRPVPRQDRASPRRPVRRLLRRHAGRRQDPGPWPDLRAPLDPPGRPSLRRDHLGVPDRRASPTSRASPSSSRRTSRSPTSGASSPPTSWSASTSAATSAPRSARPPSAS